MKLMRLSNDLQIEVINEMDANWSVVPRTLQPHWFTAFVILQLSGAI